MTLASTTRQLNTTKPKASGSWQKASSSSSSSSSFLVRSVHSEMWCSLVVLVQCATNTGDVFLLYLRSEMVS
ncbi:tetrameric potassium-selective cyclic nucleotide gated channel [Anopheles sinensis]|uniref:Tetrameric potassium-selective cyclic nucleotide gated channel n=1 Tax=Anopheles sinensis TaxID=74873 RepID=A0A084WQG0_ANOSI|nr:tetrameric potassium-selective cyclic nucleotide gated channel [Anopheles sinensis]